MASTSFRPEKVAAMNRKWLPSGRNIGHRWLVSPLAWSTSVKDRVAPPDADTRDNPPIRALGENMITSSLFQAPPRPAGAWQIARTVPVASSSFFNWLSAKNPIHFPSGDQKG